MLRLEVASGLNGPRSGHRVVMANGFLRSSALEAHTQAFEPIGSCTGLDDVPWAIVGAGPFQEGHPASTYIANGTGGLDQHLSGGVACGGFPDTSAHHIEARHVAIDQLVGREFARLGVVR